MRRLREWFHRPRVVVINMHFSGTSAPHVRKTAVAAVKAELAKLQRGDAMRLHVAQSDRADSARDVAAAIRREMQEQRRSA